MTEPATSLTTKQCVAIMTELCDGPGLCSAGFIVESVKRGWLARDTPQNGIRPEELRRFATTEFVSGFIGPVPSCLPLVQLLDGRSAPEIEALFYYPPFVSKRKVRATPLPPHQAKRVMARSKANRYVRFGRLKRQPCEVCGAEKAEKHHDDYDRPLDVRWLCRKHHMELHRKAVAA